MALYINYGEGADEATVQGAEWLQGIIADQQGADAEREFNEKFKAFVVDGVLQDLAPVFDLFVDHSQDLFAAIPEARPEERVRDVEGFFALVLSMLLLLDEEEHLDKATARLCELFSRSADQQPELRLRLLMMLYNTFNDLPCEARYRVFKHVVDFAAEASLFDQVLPYLEYLDAWMADWNAYLTIDDKRTLYRDIAQYMQAIGKRLEYFLHLKRYHECFQGENADVVGAKETQDLAVELIKVAVALPSVIQFDDILNFDTVKALDKGKHKALVELCRVFLSGTVSDLRDFNKKSPKLFEEHSLKFEDALAKVRLLSLSSIVHGKSEIALSEVAEALEEDVDDVEKWVVRAISEGVVDGRIDQLNSKVLVKTSFQRKFEKEEWSFLDSKLTQWIDNLENVIKFIGEQKVLREGLAKEATGDN
jgi:translation initiation factor 3 subunit M